MLEVSQCDQWRRRGDGDGDRQHVVHEQGARDGEAGLGAEVGGRHLVVAATARVGVHVLAVGGDHGEHQHDDRDGGEAERGREHERDREPCEAAEEVRLDARRGAARNCTLPVL